MKKSQIKERFFSELVKMDGGSRVEPPSFQQFGRYKLSINRNIQKRDWTCGFQLKKSDLDNLLTLDLQKRCDYTCEKR